MRDARSIAIEVLARCEAERIPSEPLLAPTLARSRLDARDRRLVTVLVQTTHRWRGRADRVLDQRLSRGLRSLDPRTLSILRMAYVQLFHLDQIPPHAAVHTSVDATWRLAGEGKSRLVNKILRGLIVRPPTEKEWCAGRGSQPLEGELSHPGWLIERWIRRWGEARTREICEWNNLPPDLHLRVRTGRSEADSRLRLEMEGYRVEPGAILKEALRVRGGFDVRAHPVINEGSVTIQDESQMLVGRLWPDAETGAALDYCAAPGTKTTHLRERSPDALLFAMDSALRRVRRVSESVVRLRLAPVLAVVGDGRHPPFRPVFRRVLVDAPCSALGVLRRRPDARWLRAPGDIANAARLQAVLLEEASRLVVPGGLLLYSVCTLEPEETDAQVEGFGAAHPEFMPVELPSWIPADLLAGPGMLRILPSTLGMEGLFAALWKRADGAAESRVAGTET
jgi:16S rRNA (cytosine967-C5)-methyltransferase